MKDKLREFSGEKQPLFTLYVNILILFARFCVSAPSVALHLIRNQTLFIHFVLTFSLCCGIVVDKKHVVMSNALLVLKGDDHYLHSHW